MIIFNSDLKSYSSSKIDNRIFISGFTTRETGDARKISTLLNFFSDINLVYKQIVILEQIHSVNVSLYEKQSEEKLVKIDETDGVITKEKGVILTVRTADCVPMIFSDKKNSIIGISHQGWRGGLKRMAQKMAQKMIEIGAEKSYLTVAIGPSIGDCCYDVDDDRYYSFLEEFNGFSDKIFHMHGGKRHVNLSLLNFLLLVESGIKAKNIDFFPFCTKCYHQRFFSYRRDNKNDYGEMLSFIAIQ